LNRGSGKLIPFKELKKYNVIPASKNQVLKKVFSEARNSMPHI
jgi:hypothetical protein